MSDEMRAAPAYFDEADDCWECGGEGGFNQCQEDCWRALRWLLEQMGHNDFSEGVTAQDACEIILEAIRSSEARATAAEARLADLERERDEALALTECCTSLKDMAACVIQGAHAEARLAEAVEVIREVEPFIDIIVCYASSIDEYEPNRIAKRLHAFMEQQG